MPAPGRDLIDAVVTTTLIDISTNEQKKPWFIKLNPNGEKLIIDTHYSPRINWSPGRIPVIVDNTESPPFPVMETSAELLYLLNKYDTENYFGFTDPLEQSECLQWMFFWHGSVSHVTF